MSRKTLEGIVPVAIDDSKLPEQVYRFAFSAPGNDETVDHGRFVTTSRDLALRLAGAGQEKLNTLACGIIEYNQREGAGAFALIVNGVRGDKARWIQPGEKVEYDRERILVSVIVHGTFDIHLS